jgi:glutaredoxin-like protein
LIPLREQEFLREKFSHELASRVRIHFFTQKETPLLVPGRQPCQHCKPTRQMLEELAALTDGISLRQHIFEEDKEAVAQYQVERIPAIVLHAGDKRWLKYYGLPGGYEFVTLIETIVDISRGTSYLSDKARKRLRKLKDSVRIQVFVTPACPHCPQMARLAYHMALESPCISAEVIEATEFPELSERHQVRAVPTTTIDDKMSFAGAVRDDVLVDIIERLMQPSPLTEAMTAPETGPVTPISQPGATPAAGGKLILP